MGLETAYWLAAEKGRQVTCVEMREHFDLGACTANRGHLIHYFEENGGILINCARVLRAENGQVIVSRNRAKTVPDPYCTWTPVLPENIVNPLAPRMTEQAYIEAFPADLIVMAAGTRGDDGLFLSAQENQVATELYCIGDSSCAGKPGNIWECTKAAYQLAIRI